MDDKIPCIDCISYAICRSKERVSCSILYDKYIRPPGTYVVKWRDLNYCRKYLKKDGWNINKKKKTLNMMVLQKETESTGPR